MTKPEACSPSCQCRCDTASFRQQEGNGKSIRRCEICGLLEVFPPEQEQELLKFYRDNYWTVFQDEQVSPARQNLFVHALDWIEGFTSGPGTLIDVGCGMGAFLSLAQRRGWRAMGFDPSPAAVSYASAQGLEVTEGTWPPCSLPDDQADAVTFMNVLDLLGDPFAALKEAWRVLKHRGVLYVRVPNGPLHFRLARLLRIVGLGHLPVIHRFGFGPSTFLHHLPQLGFAVESVRTAPPSQCDAYNKTHGLRANCQAVLKRLDQFTYTVSRGLGLDDRAWGLSIEVIAWKQARSAVR